ncbi:NAD-dependent epimerase/dehydratase family protein [Bacteroides uniformis]|nr:NAD-dependent epimerase/dehydratase family protein [Bacteroides uniformis]MCO7112954.1 NAD-dependent epimerase/dehydratase family protein [Bacteroides uniformis]
MGCHTLAVMGTMHEVGYHEGAIDENTPCNPISFYGIAKDALRRSMILATKSHGCVLQWIRAYYIVGDDLKSNSIFAKLRTAALEGKTHFPFTSGKNKYDFIDIDDLATQIAAVVGQKEVTGIINCCSRTACEPCRPRRSIHKRKQPRHTARLWGVPRSPL